MKTKIQKSADKVTIQLSGCLDFETTPPLKHDLNRLLNADDGTQVIFDFSELNFVGSCGITAFVQTLRDFNEKTRQRPLYCNVKNEFKRIIMAFDATQSFSYDEGNPAPSLRQLLDN